MHNLYLRSTRVYVSLAMEGSFIHGQGTVAMNGQAMENARTFIAQTQEIQ